MLITIITFLILGRGGGIELLPLPEDYENRIKTVIQDKEQRKEVEYLVKDAKEYAKVYNQRVQDMADYATNLSTDYYKDSIEFEPIYTMIYEEREAAQRKLVEFHSQLVKNITEEQWQALYNND